MMEKKYNSIVICGPTASGKTSLAVSIADVFGCEIISADSRQVYRGMDIGTGKDLNEYLLPGGRSVGYHLIDIADPSEVYSLYRYLEDFYTAFMEISSRAEIPLVCGGSGLYLEAVIRKFRIANVPENESFRESRMEKNIDELIAELKNFSDIYDRTDLTSKKRIVRALEIGEHTRNGKIEYSSITVPEIVPFIFCIRADAEERNSRIDRRLHDRITNGMIDEVAFLMKNGVTFERMQMLGLEYKWVSQYLEGILSYDEMLDILTNEIHRFAKRQMTWFRGMEKRGVCVNWIEISSVDVMAEQVNSLLSGTFSPAKK